MPTREELLAAKIAFEYPQYHWMLTIPEVGALLLDAVDPNKGFSPDEFQARLEQTSWWKNTTPATRQWTALEATDPAAARQQLTAREAQLGDMAGALGVAIAPTHIAALARWSLTFGLGDAEMRNMLAMQIGTAPGSAQGSVGETYDEVRRLARSVYLVNLSDQDAWNYARSIAAGDMTVESVQQSLGQLAAGRFPHLAENMKAGVTPGAYFAPYRQMIAQELEVSADSVDLLDPRWAEILSHADGSAVRSMTLSEAQRLVRTQPEWERTSRARTMSAQLGDELLRTFGAIA